VRTTRSIAAVAASLLALAVAPAGAGAAQWVGLGDSFAAGPLIPSQTLNPLGCLRSTRNYARVAAATVGQSLTDVSCSGARTDHVFASQSTDAGTNPPQINAVTGVEKNISIQFGGNDIGFSEIIQNCATANPFGSPCRNRYVRNGVDEISARIAATAPKVRRVIEAINAESPAARILVVNYAAILPETGVGCWPQVPLAWNDVPYLRAKQKELNAMLRTQAAAYAYTRYVDDYTASIGRDACRSSSVRWVEPLIPANAAAPFHPNARGEAGIAVSVAAAAAR
jgi:hypothetical protein